MSFFNYINNKVDLVEYINSHNILKLHKTGSRYRSCCPICGGTNDTEFVVNGQYYYCFRCRSGGNIVKFIQDYEHCTYDMAIRKLAQEYNFDISNDKQFNNEKAITDSFFSQIRECEARLVNIVDYFKQDRGLSIETINAFHLGATKSGSAYIPLVDLYGRPVACARRSFSGKLKYINSTNNALYEKDAFLFNMHKAVRMITKTLYICEGYFDAIAGHDQGLPCVSYNSSEISKQQIKVIKGICINPETAVILCPDNDYASTSHIPNMRKSFMDIAPKLQVRVVLMPQEEFEFPVSGSPDLTVKRPCKDISDLHYQGIEVASLPTQHIDQFVLEQILAKNDDVQLQYNEVGEFIKSVSNPMIRADIAKFLAEYWQQDVLEIKRWFNVSDKDTEDIVYKTPSMSLQEMERDAQLGYYTFGIPTIDNSLGGVRKKDVVIVGAYPSIGKTFFAGEYALHCAVDLDMRVLFISLEMSAGALIERLCASYLKITTDALLEKAKNGSLYEEYNSLKSKLDINLRIVDDSSIGFEDIDTIIKKANMTEFDKPVDVVIVDYLQILSNVRTFEDTEFTAKRFKWLAKENNIIFFGLSQLARGVDTWVKPVMSKLKGGGSMEASGDIILMLYKKGESPSLPIAERERLRDCVTCSIEKGRRGFNIKEVDLFFDRQTTSIREM